MMQVTETVAVPLLQEQDRLNSLAAGVQHSNEETLALRQEIDPAGGLQIGPAGHRVVPGAA
jgi:hypothetical protein